eukprot:scaffold2742_cov167-Amphora_coffeaeformis.AAC.13
MILRGITNNDVWWAVLLVAVVATFSCHGCCHAQTDGGEIRNHVVHVWHTSTDETTGITTLMEQSRVDMINTAAQAYEFSDFPNVRTPPSGMKFTLDVSLVDIRVEISTPPSSTQPYTDRLYIYFDSPFLAAILVTPASGLTAEELDVVTIDSFPPGAEYELEFVDPQIGLEVVLKPTLLMGGLVLEFANLTTATAVDDVLPLVMEFSYDLEIAPTASPTLPPTDFPTPSPTTSRPTLTAMPSVDTNTTSPTNTTTTSGSSGGTTATTGLWITTAPMVMSLWSTAVMMMMM